MKWRNLFLGLAFSCTGVRGVSVGSGYVEADVVQNSVSLSYGPLTVVEHFSFYLADKAWSTVFPERNTKAYDLTVSDSVVTAKTEDSTVAEAEAVYTIRPDGMKIDIRTRIRPDSGAHFAVCDMFLAKSLFAGAEVKRDGLAPLRLDPTAWETIPVDRVTLGTPHGDWIVSLTTDGPAQWSLRSVCDRSWGAERLRTFSLLNVIEGIPAEGVAVSLSMDLRFVPKPGCAAAMERLFGEKVSSYLTGLLKQYGADPAPSDIPVDPVPRVTYLTKQVCRASADLGPDRLDPRAGVVIPAPKSYGRGSGVFRAPPELAVACSPEHTGALEVLGEDFARAGVTLRRSEPASASTSIMMGVPARDGWIKDACQRLDLDLRGAVAEPEGYVLAVTPERVVIAGGDDAGVLYGAQTLRRLVRTGPAGAEVPAVLIRDWPDLSFRGFYVEGAGRHANTDELRRLIRNTYSHFKANAIVLELRWPNFNWQSHPELANEKSLPLSDLTALAEYARRYHLEVIPAVFTYGKVGDLIHTHPEIAEVPPEPGKRLSSSAYCPNKPETYALVFDLLNEVVEATRCRRMHIGHDEIQGMALCPACKAMAPADLFANDVNKIAGWLAERDVETMIWGDFLLDCETWRARGVGAAHSGNPQYGGLEVHPAVDKIRKDVIIADWHYNARNTKDPVQFPTLKHFADIGFRVIACPWHKAWNNYSITKDVAAVNQLGVLVTDWGFLATRSPGANSMVGVACAWDTAMPDPDRLTWSPEAVLAAAILDKDRPSFHAGAEFAPISLESVGNRPLTGAPDAWFGTGMRHRLIAPPAGNTRLFGVDYLIGPTCVVVGNEESGGGVPGNSGAIPVRLTARSLVFLHAVTVDEPALSLREGGQYRVTYASGETADIAVNGRNTTHWLSRKPRRSPWMPWKYGYTWDATLAWEGCTQSGEPVNVQAYEWVNPRPDDAIMSVEATASQEVPGLKLGLMALTAVR